MYGGCSRVHTIVGDAGSHLATWIFAPGEPGESIASRSAAGRCHFHPQYQPHMARVIQCLAEAINYYEQDSKAAYQ